MKTSLLKLAGSLVAALALTSAAIATPIQGNIFITWDFITNPVNPAFVIDTGTKIDFPTAPNAIVSFGTGSYAGLSGMQASFYDITYSPTPIAGLLWELSALTTTNFTITSFNPVDHSNGGVTVSGGGMAKMAGKDDTFGRWTLALTNVGGQYSWVSTTTVPEGGLTAAMLGLGLLGLGFAARRQKRA